MQTVEGTALSWWWKRGECHELWDAFKIRRSEVSLELLNCCISIVPTIRQSIPILKPLSTDFGADLTLICAADKKGSLVGTKPTKIMKSKKKALFKFATDSQFQRRNEEFDKVAYFFVRWKNAFEISFEALMNRLHAVCRHKLNEFSFNKRFRFWSEHSGDIVLTVLYKRF